MFDSLKAIKLFENFNFIFNNKKYFKLNSSCIEFIFIKENQYMKIEAMKNEQRQELNNCCQEEV